MTKIKASYLGNLRITSEHLQSGDQIKTDAPLDNNGQGLHFSPTDLIATGYLNCMITIIGIYCDQHGIKFEGCSGEVEKIMIDKPRRIGTLKLQLDFSKNDWDENVRKRIESAGKNCPVAKSVNPDIDIDIDFIY